MTDRVTLHIYSPAWGLPSFDRACLEMLTLCRINGFSIDVKESNNPFRTPEGRLPALYFGREGSPLTGFREVRSRLETLNFNSDYNLEEKQINERGLIENYVETALKPALEYLFWINPEVHGHVVRPLYSSKIPFPFGSYYLPKYHKEAIDYISVLYNVHHDDLEHGDSSVQTRANFKAQECLDFLTHRLAEKEFIFGKSPSSLDALVYSYLAPIAKIPLDSHPLGVYMKEKIVKISLSLWIGSLRITIMKSNPTCNEKKKLGDDYARDEFKRHATADPTQTRIFMDEWTKYAMDLSKQLGIKGPKTSKPVGSQMSPNQIDSLSVEQIAQLYELYQETIKPKVASESS
ncbi:MTX [Lepeophtheirus salmonis]|uniref:MTX n=1 Tax=Lepeophtheirus salmonis TaxID=72036 RepID=A0A7R8CBE9_LEPSM|nr:MTX [Lepeophtheirus salmonis]CAF2759690.1 MTX [Lepeophtheirus salmonis]